MLRRSRIALAAAALSITTFAFAAHAKLVGVGKGKATIDIEATPMVDFSFKLSQITAKEEGDKLVFRGNLSTNLDMGIRASHTREVFKICDPENRGKDPCKDTFVTLTIDKSKLVLPADGKDVEAKVPARLKLGDWKPITVTVDYKAERDGAEYEASAKFAFDYTALGLDEIVKMKVKVERNIQVSISGVKLQEK